MWRLQRKCRAERSCLGWDAGRRAGGGRLERMERGRARFDQSDSIPHDRFGGMVLLSGFGLSPKARILEGLRVWVSDLQARGPGLL